MINQEYLECHRLLDEHLARLQANFLQAFKPLMRQITLHYFLQGVSHGKNINQRTILGQ